MEEPSTRDLSEPSTRDLFNCPVCLEFARNAVECNSCHNIMCESCVMHLQKITCPTCRTRNFKWSPNIAVRRMIAQMSCSCTNGCGQHMTIGNLADHLKICEKRVYVCSECKGENQFSGQRGEFVQHMAAAHETQVAELFDQNVQDDLSEPCARKYAQLAFDRIAKVKNEHGCLARVGASGKYYCGSELDYDCNCCDGFCGPDNGCNCVACMKLDIKARALPKGYLVNKLGRTARRGTTGKFYCGAKVMDGVAFCDGWCGPTDGPACKYCKILNEQAEGQYRQLLS